MKQAAQTYQDHSRAIWKLGMPLILSNLAQFAIHITDTIMLGWYSVTALAASTIAGTMFFVIFLTSNVWVVAAALFVEMFAGLLWNVVTVSYRQRLIPDDLLGRVNSIYRFFGWGLMPVGALLAGGVVALAEPDLGREAALRLPYVIAGCIAVILGIYGFLRLRL